MSGPIAAGDVLLGKYRVERVLGQGGMGVVVAVRHIELDDLFAMKFLLPSALAHPDAVERFLREARASARLKGEHVVRVQDVGRLPEGMPYMVMEYLAGSDLKDVVQQRGALPVAEALTYVLQACEALAEAHSLGIVHRDLKPANMFLTRRRNGSPCVKVLDFGISKQIDAESAEQHALTRTGTVLGSPLYMSPEQMMRTKEADPRGDIWSMGVVLYQLLTGTVPFLSDVLTELVGKVLQEAPLPPSQHRPDIPYEVDVAVMTCLQKRREQRFQSVDQLMDALRAALTRAPSAPRAVTPAATLLLEAGVSSGPGEARSAQPSQPDRGGGALPLFAPSVSGTGPRLAAIPASAMSSPGQSLTSPGGAAGQTGQAWGTTAGSGNAVPAPKRTGILLAGTALGLFVLGGAALAAWRFGGDSANTTEPPAGARVIEATPATAASPGTATPSASNSGPPLSGPSDSANDPVGSPAPPPAQARPPSTAATSTAATSTAATSTAAPACKSRFECKAPLICANGQCVAPSCTNDAACGAGRFCSVEGQCEALGASKPANGCKSHLDCKAPLVCPSGTCVAPSCAGDADCGAGRFCSLEGQCKTLPGGTPAKQ